MSEISAFSVEYGLQEEQVQVPRFPVGKVSTLVTVKHGPVAGLMAVGPLMTWGANKVLTYLCDNHHNNTSPLCPLGESAQPQLIQRGSPNNLIFL